MSAENSATNSEFELPMEGWFNFFAGMEPISAAAVSHSEEMSETQQASYKSFLQDVRTRLDGTVEGLDKEKPYCFPDDWTVLRFLQADNYDSKLAMKRIIETMVWHQTVNLADLVTTNPPKQLQAYRNLRVRLQMGYSKNGMPIFVERMGQFMNALDSKEGKELTEEDYKESALYDMGDIIRGIRMQPNIAAATAAGTNGSVAGKVTWQVGWIMDFRGISYLKAMKATSTIKILNHLIEPRFPEIAGPIFLINVPTIVMGVWLIVKRFLHPSVVSKIEVHKGVPTEKLLETIDESVLFKEFGGTNEAEFRKTVYT